MGTHPNLTHHLFTQTTITVHLSRTSTISNALTTLVLQVRLHVRSFNNRDVNHLVNVHTATHFPSSRSAGSTHASFSVVKRDLRSNKVISLLSLHNFSRTSAHRSSGIASGMPFALVFGSTGHCHHSPHYVTVKLELPAGGASRLDSARSAYQCMLVQRVASLDSMLTHLAVECTRTRKVSHCACLCCHGTLV